MEEVAHLSLAELSTRVKSTPPGQIAQTPSDDTVKIRRRPPFDGLCQGRPLTIVRQ